MKSHQLVVRQLPHEIRDRCNDLPVEADLATKILKPKEWKYSKFFKIKSGSCVSPMYHLTEIFNSDIKKNTSKAEIHLQLESNNIVLSEILSEWTFLKLKLVQWSKNDFPPESWESIGMKFEGLSNLFGLIDYFLTLGVSSPKADCGFFSRDMRLFKMLIFIIRTIWNLSNI